MIGPPQGPAIRMDCQQQDTRLLDSKIMLSLLLQMSKMGPELEEGGFVGVRVETWEYLYNYRNCVLCQFAQNILNIRNL